MKITVSKIDVSVSQLKIAIRLFLEDRDPVSIHTLVGASLTVLNDHIRDRRLDLIIRKDSIFIKDEMQGLWAKKINEAKNFFKHADKDLAKGITTFEFETELNEIFIFEACRCLKIVDYSRYVDTVEIYLFSSWFMTKNRNFFANEIQAYIESLDKLIGKDKKFLLDALILLDSSGVDNWEKVEQFASKGCKYDR